MTMLSLCSPENLEEAGTWGVQTPGHLGFNEPCHHRRKPSNSCFKHRVPHLLLTNIEEPNSWKVLESTGMCKKSISLSCPKDTYNLVLEKRHLDWHHLFHLGLKGRWVQATLWKWLKPKIWRLQAFYRAHISKFQLKDLQNTLCLTVIYAGSRQFSFKRWINE